MLQILTPVQCKKFLVCMLLKTRVVMFMKSSICSLRILCPHVAPATGKYRGSKNTPSLCIRSDGFVPHNASGLFFFLYKAVLAMLIFWGLNKTLF